MIFLLFCSFMVGLVDDRSAKSVLDLDFFGGYFEML